MCVHNGQKNIQQTIRYLKSKLREQGEGRTLSSERCINLIHCLQELNDHSMAEEMQSFLPTNRKAENKLSVANSLVDELKKADQCEHFRLEEKRRRLV